jgi:hypothetical protein
MVNHYYHQVNISGKIYYFESFISGNEQFERVFLYFN